MSSSSSSVPTEFVADAFETTVSDDERFRLIETINDAVSNLRDQIEDDTLEYPVAGSKLVRRTGRADPKLTVHRQY